MTVIIGGNEPVWRVFQPLGSISHPSIHTPPLPHYRPRLPKAAKPGLCAQSEAALSGLTGVKG